MAGGTNVGTKISSIDTQVNNNTNKITSLSNEVSSNTTKLNNLSIVNVKDFGAKGDGSTDDTAAIQSALNSGKSVYFPKGTYIVSSGLQTTNNTDVNGIKIMLDAQAVIKGKSGFSGSWLFTIGYPNNTNIDSGLRSQNEICGGHFDCNNGACANGIRVIGVRHVHVHDLVINEFSGIGLQIDKPSTNLLSSDCYVNNINILAKWNQNSIGFVLNGFDNNVRDIRTYFTKIGVQVNGGGNYISDVHPLQYGTTQEAYNGSIGFSINANDTYLIKCYSDMFLTAFSIGDNCKTTIRDCIATTDSTGYNMTRILVKVSGANLNKLIIDGLTWLITKTGTAYKFIGYDGPTALNIGARDAYRPAYFKGISVPFSLLTNKNKDHLIWSELNIDKTKPFIYGGTGGYDLNYICASGEYSLNGDFSSLHGLSFNMNGLLKVESYPATYGYGSHIIFQTFITSDNLYYREYQHENDPLGSNPGTWSGWRRITGTLV
jgi:hypothetical protein